MKYHLNRYKLETTKGTRIYDITDKVISFIKKSKTKNGHILIQPLHTTSGIYINENEKGLFKDLIKHLKKAVPELKGKYLHDDLIKRNCPPDEPINGHSHIKSVLYSNPSLTLILSKGNLQLGKYQRILFTEFDGPCPRKNKEKRQVLISIIGE
jgi:secondary thiamine-phosphate synthase enzyme